MCNVLCVSKGPKRIAAIFCISAEAFRQFVSELSVNLAEHFHRPIL